MKRYVLVSVALAVFTMASLMSAQNDAQNEAPKSMSSPTNWKVTDVSVEPLFGGVICGPQASLYLRKTSGVGNPFESKITIVSADGTSRSFDPKEGTGFQGRLVISAFNVDSDGKIYAVANPSEEYQSSYLIAYDNDGHFVWKASLRQPLHATFVLPMGKGRFLITGVLPPRAGAKPTTVTSLFDKGGNEIKSLKLPEEDAAASQMADGTYFNAAVQLSNARVGESGSAYLLKATNPPIVEVITPDGDVLKTFRLAPPEAGLQAFDLLLTNHSFAVEYAPAGDAEPKPPKFGLYNSATGELKGRYLTPATMAPSCSEGNLLTFLASTSDHKLYTVGTAELR